MHNCFTKTYEYLAKKGYKLPTQWHGFVFSDIVDMSDKERANLTKTKQHIAFFNSFCNRVKRAKKDDIILTKEGVGIAINSLSYMVLNEIDRADFSLIDKNCIIMRVRDE